MSKDKKHIKLILAAFVLIFVIAAVLLIVFALRNFADKSVSKKGLWPTQNSIKKPVEMNFSGEGIVIGDLFKYGILVEIPDNTFENKTQIRLSKPEHQIQYDDLAFSPLSDIYQVEFIGDQQRTDEPVTIKLKFDSNNLLDDRDLGGICVVHYHDDNAWTYFSPKEVNLIESYIVIETYHNWLFGAAELTQTQRIDNYLDQRSRQQWAMEKLGSEIRKDIATDLNAVVEPMVKSLLIDGFGSNDQKLIYEITEDVIKMVIGNKKYGDVIVSLYEKDLVALSSNICKHAGEVIANHVKSGVLKTTTGLTGTAASAAGALSAGDVDGALAYLADYSSDHILNNALSIPLKAISREIDYWKNNEIEKAYLAYRDGGSGNLFWGYNNEKNDFEDLWQQMRALRRQVIIEYDSDEVKAKAAIKATFDKRISQERELATIRKQQADLINIFLDEDDRIPELNYNLMMRHKSTEESMEQFFDRLFLYTQEALIHTGREHISMDRYFTPEHQRDDKTIHVDTLKQLLDIRLSSSGDDDWYNQQLMLRGLVPPDDRFSIRFEGEREVTLLLESGQTQITHSFNAQAEPAGLYKFVWDFGDGRRISTNPEQEDLVLSGGRYTYRNLTENTVFYAEVKLVNQQYEDVILASDRITIRILISDQETQPVEETKEPTQEPTENPENIEQPDKSQSISGIYAGTYNGKAVSLSVDDKGNVTGEWLQDFGHYSNGYDISGNIADNFVTIDHTHTLYFETGEPIVQESTRTHNVSIRKNAEGENILILSMSWESLSLVQK